MEKDLGTLASESQWFVPSRSRDVGEQQEWKLRGFFLWAQDAKLPKEERITNSNVIRLPNAWATPMEDIPNAGTPLLVSLQGSTNARYTTTGATLGIGAQSLTRFGMRDARGHRRGRCCCAGIWQPSGVVRGRRTKSSSFGALREP